MTLRQQVEVSTALRFRRLRDKAWQVGQCAVAAGLSWFVVSIVIGHGTPIGPIAAVLALGTLYRQRMRRIAEVVAGVAIGVLLGDLVVMHFGSGPLQMAVVVALAMCTALLLDTGALVATQAAVQSIVVCILLPGPGEAFLRWTDAIIGALCALVVAAVVPGALLRRPAERAALIVERIAELLLAAADTIDHGDVSRATALLSEARAASRLVGELQVAAAEGHSVVTSSPLQRRHRRRVAQVTELAEPLDNALRNTRVLVRRIVVATYRGDPLPGAHAQLMRDLAACAGELSAELRAHRTGEGIRPALVDVAGASSLPASRPGSLSAAAVLAQIRSITADLLTASGMGAFEAIDAIPPASWGAADHEPARTPTAASGEDRAAEHHG